MRLPFSRLAITAGVLSVATALSPREIPADVPIASLLDTAQTHLAKRETNEAIVYYDAAIARDPKNYLTIFKRATAFLAVGRSSQATDDFNRVLALKPGFHGAHVQLAKIKSKTADWKGARADYVAAGAMTAAAESQELAELEAAEGAAAAAAEAFKGQRWDDCVGNAGIAIGVASRSPQLREIRSSCRFARGEIEEGMSDLQHILHLRPGDTAPHVLIAATSFYALGDVENGLAQIRKCLHSDPDSKVCKAFLNLAKPLRKAFNKATEQLNKGQLTTAGRTIVGTEENPGLISEVQEQTKKFKEDGSIPATAGSKLYEMLVEMACQAYSEAEKYCRDALELNPGSFWGVFFRAKSQLKKEEPEAALETLRTAWEQHPEQRERMQAVMDKARAAVKRSKTTDYYKVLGVARDADGGQIKKAYRRACKLFHPDKARQQNLSKDEADRKMKAITEAYEVLRDDDARAAYDRGEDPNAQQQHHAQHPFHGSPFGGAGGGGGGGNQYMFHQGGGQQFKFQWSF